MIKSFRSKALAEFWASGGMARLDAKLVPRIRRMLSRLDAAKVPAEMNLPGFKFHRLSGERAGTFAISVNGPWRITFKWDGEDAVQIDLEQYH